ncbi:MAG: cytochrome c, partial [Hyphomicrobiales bacterium]
VLRLLVLLAILGVFAAVGLWITRPMTEDPDQVSALTPDVENGKVVFFAGGCASCHAAEGSSEDAKQTLAGGQAFPSQFGTFYAPNISSDPTYGIGDWSALDLINAMKHGTSPAGTHYYPAFPYASYAKADVQDIVDLRAYLATLPADETTNTAHAVGFPYNIRALLGGWKMLFLNNDWVQTSVDTPELERGRYLVEALGHCAECHTPRNILGGMKTNEWLIGAPNPSGKGRAPGISPDTLDWGADDIAEYLNSGFTPDFDSVGGHMAAVVENTANLSDSDRAAIGAYLKALP